MASDALRRHHHRHRRGRRHARPQARALGQADPVLERGGYLPREQENWDRDEVFGKGRYLTGRGLDRQARRRAFNPQQQYFVGGNTKFYGAILFRMRERDFERGRATTAASRPAWPIAYADLEPYYTEAERLYLVHGAGRRGPDRAAALRPFPHPAVSHEPRIQQLARRLRAHRPQPVPPAGRRRPGRARPGGRALRALRPLRRLPVPRRTARPTPTCSACGRRSSTPTSRCSRTRRSSGSRPTRRGRASRGSWSTATAREETYSADVVVVSCGAVNSAALLLRSASDQPPERARRTRPTRSAATTWRTSTPA